MILCFSARGVGCPQCHRQQSHTFSVSLHVTLSQKENQTCSYRSIRNEALEHFLLTILSEHLLPRLALLPISVCFLLELPELLQYLELPSVRDSRNTSYLMGILMESSSQGAQLAVPALNRYQGYPGQDAPITFNITLGELLVNMYKSQVNNNAICTPN